MLDDCALAHPACFACLTLEGYIKTHSDASPNTGHILKDPDFQLFSFVDRMTLSMITGRSLLMQKR